MDVTRIIGRKLSTPMNKEDAQFAKLEKCKILILKLTAERDFLQGLISERHHQQLPVKRHVEEHTRTRRRNRRHKERVNRARSSSFEDSDYYNDYEYDRGYDYDYDDDDSLFGQGETRSIKRRNEGRGNHHDILSRDFRHSQRRGGPNELDMFINFAKKTSSVGPSQEEA
jgi:hypothetical protein